MEWVETTGRTIEEAKDAALDQLGVDESDAEFVIVTEPRAGLFGRVRGEARVRARVRPTSPRPKRTRARRPASTREGGRGRTTAKRSRTRAQSDVDGDGGGGIAVVDENQGADADRAHVGAPAANGAQPTRRRRSRGRRSSTRPSGTEGGGERPGAAEDQPRATARRGGSRQAGSTKEEHVGETQSLEEQGEAARGFVAGIVSELGLHADVTHRLSDEETAEVTVEGPELGVLIGPGGATLAALQELARTFVQKTTGGHSGRIVVDVAGYRAKRTEALRRFTRQIADEALAEQSERTLEPMSAADRKVVHDTINEIEGLSTRSEGEEPQRYIVIIPDGAAPSATDGGA
jgi:spoIIIJ-associated protein